MVRDSSHYPQKLDVLNRGITILSGYFANVKLLVVIFAACLELK